MLEVSFEITGLTDTQSNYLTPLRVLAIISQLCYALTEPTAVPEGSSKDSQDAVVYGVVGSLLSVLVLAVIGVVAILVYLRWKAYSYKLQPKFQGTASSLKESQYVIYTIIP